MAVKESFVYIPKEEPLLDYESWDRIRDMIESRQDKDALIDALREYANQAALYISHELVRRPETATDREWLAAATSTVASIAAARQMTARNGDELVQRARAIENGYLRLTALLLAWAAVTELRRAQRAE
jgi:hypothetical protein